jgi:aryl-alcohol dehydrogenase-like predicted oxidoreductase
MDGLGWLKDKNLTDLRNEKVRQLGTLAAEMNLSLAVFGLAWCLKNPNVSTVILGASKEEQLKENLTAMDAVHRFTPEIMETIEAIMQNKPRRPDY